MPDQYSSTENGDNSSSKGTGSNGLGERITHAQRNGGSVIVSPSLRDDLPPIHRHVREGCIGHSAFNENMHPHLHAVYHVLFADLFI
jgi:hypothetical protein